jgi:hypothetical protein
MIARHYENVAKVILHNNTATLQAIFVTANFRFSEEEDFACHIEHQRRISSEDYL